MRETGGEGEPLFSAPEQTNPGSLLEGRLPGSSRGDGSGWSNRRVATRGGVTGSRVAGIDQVAALFRVEPVLLNTPAMD